MNTGTWQAIASLGGAGRTELTHRVEIAHRLQVERRRLQARALEGCIHSRFEVLRQRFHGAYRSRRGLRRSARRRWRPSEHDPILSRRVLPDDSKAGRGVAGRGYSSAHHVDVSRGGHLRAPGRKPTPRGSRECRTARVEDATLPDAGRPSRQQANRCGILFRTRPRASPRWPSVTSSSVKLMAVLRRWSPNAATAARDDVAVCGFSRASGRHSGPRARRGRGPTRRRRARRRPRAPGRGPRARTPPCGRRRHGRIPRARCSRSRRPGRLRARPPGSQARSLWRAPAART